MNVTLYTDASFKPETRAGGWAAWYKKDGVSGLVGGPLKMSRPASRSSTTCELEAIANGVEVLRKRGLLAHDDRLIIVTDSKLAMGEIMGFPEGGSMAGPPTPPRHIWTVVRETGVHLLMRHVKSHQDMPGCKRSYVNNLVDREAKKWRKVSESRKPPAPTRTAPFGTAVLPNSLKLPLTPVGP